MKRTGYLIEEIADTCNLRTAFCKAAKGKRDRMEVRHFSVDFNQNISFLSQGIRNGVIPTGNHHFFTVYDPKKREICAACFQERILHHAIMNVCDCIFESFQIADSYACRQQKGNLKAVERCRVFSMKYQWFISFDVKKFYDTVNHEILTRQLSAKFKDKKLLNLFSQILGDFYVLPSRGLPIGHLTSQHLANFYLAHLDHFIKEQLGIKGYIRYMDDMVIWGNDRLRLKQMYSQIVFYLKNNLDLEVKPDWIMSRASSGVNFLGYRVFPNRILLSSKSKARFLRKLDKYIRHYDLGDWSEAETQRRLESLFAFVRNADTLQLRKSVLVSRGYDQKLEPCYTWWQLEQLRQELPVSVPQQEHAGEPLEQQRLPRGDACNSMVSRRLDRRT
jgi:RNA-directed DNA polymerase